MVDALDGRLCGSTGRVHPCRYAEADPHGPGDHRGSAVAREQGVDVPGWQVLRVPQVQVVQMTVGFPQLHLVEDFAVCPDVRMVLVIQTPESLGTARGSSLSR